MFFIDYKKKLIKSAILGFVWTCFGFLLAITKIIPLFDGGFPDPEWLSWIAIFPVAWGVFIVIIVSPGGAVYNFPLGTMMIYPVWFILSWIIATVIVFILISFIQYLSDKIKLRKNNLKNNL